MLANISDEKERKVISDDTAKKLHDRSSRGATLSAKEQAQLQAWYASQDNAESVLLGLPSSEKKVASLQSQVDAALTQLMTVTKRIQEIASENETLRREIATLRHQLAQHLGTQPA
jgi:predicted hotdog family 3-hydroxylacyl-ACP dehydratase